MESEWGLAVSEPPWEGPPNLPKDVYCALYVVGEYVLSYITDEDLSQLNKWLMPCGNHTDFDSIEDIPREDVECSCGNSLHWLVKWEKENENT